MTFPGFTNKQNNDPDEAKDPTGSTFDPGFVVTPESQRESKRDAQSSWRTARDRQLQAFGSLGQMTVGLASAVLGITVLVISAGNDPLEGLLLLKLGWIFLFISLISGVLRTVAHVIWAHSKLTRKFRFGGLDTERWIVSLSASAVVGLILGLLFVVIFAWCNLDNLAS